MADDFVCVPREPTEDMMNAGLYQASHDAQWADVYSSWRDMLAAAPSTHVAVPTEVLQWLTSQMLDDEVGPRLLDTDLSRAALNELRALLSTSSTGKNNG